MPLFAQNIRHQRGNTAIGRAVMKLSMADYQVLKTTTGAERPSIQIDRPFEGQEHQITDHGGKRFGSTEYCDCRVYWAIPEEVAA